MTPSQPLKNRGEAIPRISAVWQRGEAGVPTEAMAKDGGKVVTFVEDFATQPERRNTVCTSHSVFRRAAGIVLLALIASACIGVPSADAGCTLREERAEFHRAVRDTLVCAGRRLRSSRATDCQAATPPACGADQFSQVIELLGGIPDRPSTAVNQAMCQVAAYRGARRFLVRRMKERERGLRRQRRSRASMVRLRRRCSLPLRESEGQTLPRFGGRCAGLQTLPLGFLSGDRVEQCLRPALEEIVTDLLDLPPVQPNVVLIVSDDQFPEGIDLMPNLSDLATRGVNFTNAFATTTICGPARAGILTGQHATTNGVLNNGWFADPDTFLWAATGFDDSSTLATWYQAAGYRTALVGKYLNGYRQISPEIPRGWDEWRVLVSDTNNFFDYKMNENGVIRFYGDAPADYSTDVISNAAIGFATESADVPFFLMVTPFAPHGPSEPAPRHLGRFDALPLWRPPSWGEDIQDKPGWIRFFAKSDQTLLDTDEITTRARESLLAVDDSIKAISTTLEDLGLTDNTIFVFTTDQGYLRGEHRWIGKQVPYEEAIRIPLTIRYPLQLPAGEVREQMALNIDIAPTLLTLTGVQATHEMDGRSLVGPLAPGEQWRTDFVVQHFIGGFTVPPWDSLRGERYKYVRHEKARDTELYDLVSDPYELDNIALLPENAELLATLSARLDELLAR